MAPLHAPGRVNLRCLCGGGVQPPPLTPFLSGCTPLRGGSGYQRRPLPRQGGCVLWEQLLPPPVSFCPPPPRAAWSQMTHRGHRRAHLCGVRAGQGRCCPPWPPWHQHCSPVRNWRLLLKTQCLCEPSPAARGSPARAPLASLLVFLLLLLSLFAMQRNSHPRLHLRIPTTP